MTTAHQLYEFAALSQSSYAFLGSLATQAVRSAITDQTVLVGDRLGQMQAEDLIGPAAFSALHHVPN